MMDGQDNLGQIAALAARVRVLETELQTARAAVVSAIEEEPELPGEMPNDMYKTILSLDRQGLEEWCRILVRATKEGILERYQRALALKQQAQGKEEPPPSPA